MNSLLLVLYFFLSLVYALPSPAKRDVWVPPITYPVADTVWVAGETYNVTWDTSTKPQEVTSYIGQIYLRRDGLTQNSPIAQGFNLTDGAANVTIPLDTQSDCDWIIVLFGDSGNWSPPFTIVAPRS